MKLSNYYKTTAVAIFGLVLLTGCHRTELCYDHFPKATVSLDWEQEWERDYGMGHINSWDAAYHGHEYDHLRPDRPESINLIKFQNGTSEGTHFLQTDGGEVGLQEDAHYSFLIYNSDTEYVIVEDAASLADARASATSRSRSLASYLIERHPNAKSSNPPDVLYSAYIDNVPFVEVHQNLQLPVKMQPLVFTYLVRYEFEYGLEHVSLARGALAGMAESVYLRDGRTSEESNIILYDCQLTDYGFEAQVRTFGVPNFPDDYYGRNGEDTPERPYTLNLEVLLTNGSIMEFNIDVADQIEKQPRGGVITFKKIRVEDDDNSTPIGSGAFDVDLSGWGQVEMDMPLPDYYD